MHQNLLATLGLTQESGAVKDEAVDAKITLNGVGYESSKNTFEINGLTPESIISFIALASPPKVSSLRSRASLTFADEASNALLATLGLTQESGAVKDEAVDAKITLNVP